MKIIFIFFIIISLSFSACSPAVHTEKVADANFDSYQTYAMLPTGQNIQDDVVDVEKIINEVNQEMRSREYTLDTQDPDLLVNVRIMLQEEEAVVREGYTSTYDYYTPGFYTPATMPSYYFTNYKEIPYVSGTGIKEVEYLEGIVLVDVIEAKGKNRIIWRGWSQRPVDPSNFENSVREYIDKIFEEYPVDVAKK
jgi:hypothetical protein